MKRSKQYAKYALLLLLIPISIVLFFMDQVGLVKLYRQNHTEKQDMVYNAVSLYEKQGKEKSTKNLQLYARSAALMDADNGRILYQKNGTKRVPMASTTKIMTCLVVLENANLDDVVLISANAAKQPKVKLNVIAGEKYYVKDLLYALMLESCNDVAVALAEHVGKSVEGFAELMNQKAQELQCYNTHFVTPNGLDSKEHYSTAEDLCKMGAYAIKNETFVAITNTSSHQFSEISKGRSCAVHNKDAFLSMYAGAMGIKTGFTGNAGYCFVGAVKKEDRRLTSAVLASGWPPNKSYKWADTTMLMNYGCDAYRQETVFSCSVQPPMLRVHSGKNKSVAVTFEPYEDEMLVNGEETQKVVSVTPQYIDAPAKKGMEVGKVYYFLNDDAYKISPIYTQEDVFALDLLYIWKGVVRLFLL
ncbi:serine-type D-Ala-D-Ala carboxypeptidase [Clostridium sp. CAG:411]|jgi:D-alanyl-D-alanine carboxypeptidase (penicillin-binding protein 5/6)|nr:D-alanyl-D-alanine carboxypeptidase family protein [Lachnospiraceae bacterium]CDE43244.1 serine-type D-Ala-D-Ala carboxypeptidase [Clostridium sp. CAG:411]